MALQPIDLQTLFSQLDKVAKTQAAQRDGVAVQQALQGTHLERKNEENIQSVNEAQDMGDGVEKVKDREHQRGGEGKEDGREREAASEDGQPEKPRHSFFSDPSLGNKIDISF